MPEGGEFNEPPPLGPPPARDFREGNYGYGPGAPPGAAEAPPRAKWRSRPAATARKGGEPKQTTQERQTAGTGNRGAAATATSPAGAAVPAAPVARNAAEPAKAEPSPSNAAAQPRPDAGSSSAAQAKEGAPPAGPAGASPAPAPAGKKVNDVPVNPLD